MNQSKKKALDRGRSAILSERTSETNSTSLYPQKSIGHIIEIPLKGLVVKPYQLRTRFNQEQFQELSESIHPLGVIHPITVRRENNNFQLISSKRSYHACELADLTSVPGFIRSANDTEMLEIALVKNIQRYDLDIIEIALYYRCLIQDIQVSQEELRQRIGGKRTTISNQPKLLEFTPITHLGIRDGVISMGNGRSLINIENSDNQLGLYEKIIRKALSVWQTEELTKQHKKNRNSGKKDSLTNPINPFKKAVKSIEKYINKPVEIQRKSTGKGKIIIPFNPDEDFKRIKKLLS